MEKTFAAFLLIFSMVSNFVMAQDETTNVIVYGNQDQLGTNMHEAIQARMLNGETLLYSSEFVVGDFLTEANTPLSALASQAITADKQSTIEFMRNMVSNNDLFEATKVTIESAPENIISIINISVALYPEFAQEVINAAVMTGEMDSEQALLAAISAGADPTTVGEATAAGGQVALTLAAPVGVGVGAGGTGGGDATASTN